MSSIPFSCSHRIKYDIKQFMKQTPSGIFGVSDEHDLMTFHALIIGVEGTPYEKGFFYFVLKFPTDYPHSPPAVQFMTTGGGMVRIHPNLYACGKVCLSLLGTWVGPEWTSAQSLSSLLISIQSLFDEWPYYNEPGKTVNEQEAKQYNEIILHETLRYAVLGMVRNDFHLQMPITLQLHIQQLFAQNISYYDSVVIRKQALTGNIMLDPLYGAISGSNREFDYRQISKELEEIKKQLKI